MPTLASLRTSVYREADLLDGQVDDTDVNALLNEELARLYERIVTAYEAWVSSEATLTIASGQDLVALPADFFRPIDVEDLRYTNPRSMDTFEFKDRNRFNWSGGDGLYDRRWCIQGSNLLVRPSASAPGNYRLTYTPLFAPLPDDNVTSFDPPNQLHTYAVLGVAIRLRSMQELATAGLEQRRAALEKELEEAAQGRKGPHKVRYVRGTGYRRGHLGDWWWR